MPQVPSSVSEVVARIEASVASLPRSDGVACFTRLYLDVTKGVQQELAGITFGDPRFLAQLDIAFANLFFSAMDGATHKPTSVPRAWAPLVEARGRAGSHHCSSHLPG